MLSHHRPQIRENCAMNSKERVIILHDYTIIYVVFLSLGENKNVE
jgi:hypothetical protein